MFDFPAVHMQDTLALDCTLMHSNTYSVLTRSNAHSCTQMHTRTPKCTLTHSYEHSSTHMHTHALKCPNTQMHTDLLKCTLLHTHALKCTFIHSNAHSHTQMHSHALKCSLMHLNLHSHCISNAHSHTQLHTHTLWYMHWHVIVDNKSLKCKRTQMLSTHITSSQEVSSRITQEVNSCASVESCPQSAVRLEGFWTIESTTELTTFNVFWGPYESASLICDPY